MGVEGRLGGVGDALDEDFVVELAGVGGVGRGGEDGERRSIEEVAGEGLYALALAFGVGGVVEGRGRRVGECVAEVGYLLDVRTEGQRSRAMRWDMSDQVSKGST